MHQRVDTDLAKRGEVEILQIRRIGLQDHLILIVVLQAIGVVAIASIAGAPARLHIGRTPGFATQCSQNGGGMQRPGPDLDVVRLENGATLRAPKGVQR